MRALNELSMLDPDFIPSGELKEAVVPIKRELMQRPVHQRVQLSCKNVDFKRVHCKRRLLVQIQTFLHLLQRLQNHSGLDRKRAGRSLL